MNLKYDIILRKMREADDSGELLLIPLGTSGAVTLDGSKSDKFKLKPTGAVPLSLSNIPELRNTYLALEAADSNVSFPSEIEWQTDMPTQSPTATELIRFNKVTYDSIERILAWVDGSFILITPNILLHLDDDILDSSATETIMTTTGSISTEKSKFGDSSLKLNTGNVLVPPQADEQYYVGKNNGNYTLDFWINPIAIRPSGYQWIIIDVGVASGSLMLDMNSDSALVFSKWGGTNYTTASNIVSVGTWTHVAIEQEGLRNRLYVDGELLVDEEMLVVDDCNWQFARPSDGVNAYIDEVYFARGAKYKGSNFTPPTAPYA